MIQEMGEKVKYLLVSLAVIISGCLFSSEEPVQSYHYKIQYESGSKWMEYKHTSNYMSEDSVKLYRENGSIEQIGTYSVVNGILEFVVKNKDSLALDVSTRNMKEHAGLGLRPQDSAFLSVIRNFTPMNEVIEPIIQQRKISGELQVDIFVNPNGNVDYVICVRNATNDKGIVALISQEIKKWKFEIIGKPMMQIIGLPITLKPS